MRAGIEGASARRAVARALEDPALRAALTAQPLHLVAAGKAAASMTTAFFEHPDLACQRALAIGTHRTADLPDSVEWHEASHPVPDERSVRAGAAALAAARRVSDGECLVILLSGGASALMAHPAEGLSLDDKQQVVRAMLASGADIHAINMVRKHLSAVKGGRLAAACRGRTLTLAVSDVVGDDLTSIGSGPGVPDPSTWAEAAAHIARWIADAEQPHAVRALVAMGVSGAVADTPKPGDAAVARAGGQVIARRQDALDGARRAAEQLGYRVFTLDEPITGEARLAAPRWLSTVDLLVRADPGAVCVLSGGETTVQVAGPGRGGRNQEFALALAQPLADRAGVAAASIGTDGIDGPTDAAGAVVDSTTLARAAERGLAPPDRYLDANDSYAFFDQLGDLIRVGRTETNVGDVQVFLAGIRQPA